MGLAFGEVGAGSGKLFLMDTENSDEKFTEWPRFWTDEFPVSKPMKAPGAAMKTWTQSVVTVPSSVRDHLVCCDCGTDENLQPPKRGKVRCSNCVEKLARLREEARIAKLRGMRPEEALEKSIDILNDVRGLLDG